MSQRAQSHDLIVIGAGPGGYVAALRAAQRGLRTALVEREQVGGVCLNWGCIPTKALLRSAHLHRQMREAASFGLRATEVGFDYPAVVARSRQTVDRLVKGVQFLLRQASVDVITGRGRLSGLHDGLYPVAVESETAAGTGVPLELCAPKVILATGARPRSLPALPVDGERIVTSRTALAQTTLPRRLLIVGAGAIGVEFADIFQAFGVEVTIVEMLPRLLPESDPEASAELARAFAKRRIRVLLASMVEGVTAVGETLSCRIAPAEGATTTIEVDRVLVAVGLTGNTEDLGLETVGVAPERGFVKVDAQQRAAGPGLYAIGDLTGPPLLAHAASAEGILAADHAAGLAPGPIERDWVPGVVYTQPAIATVGLDEAAARARHGDAVQVGRFAMRASGRAVAEGETAGFTKVVLERGSGRLLGATVVGPGADELIAELVVIGRCGVRAAELLQVIHAHPTLSETIPEAFGAALGEGIHA
jgi:dihydrolipoamide dehydrogenase